VLVLAVAEELVVDELRAVIGVDAQEGEGKSGAKFLEASKDMDLGFVFQGLGLGPAGGNVCQGKSLAVFVEGCAAVMGNEIGFTKPGALLIPIGKGSDGDVVFE
jgi:hypothetical protein